MKYLGKTKRGCECRFCTGAGDSKAINKALKHGERQKVKKDIKKEIRRKD